MLVCMYIHNNIILYCTFLLLYSHVLGLGVVLAALSVPSVHSVGVSLGGVLSPRVVSRARTRARSNFRAQ